MGQRDLAFAVLAASAAAYDAARNSHPGAAGHAVGVPLAAALGLTIAGRRTNADLAALIAAALFQIAVLAGFPGGALLVIGAVVAHGAAGYGRRFTPLLAGVALLTSGVAAIGQWVVRGGDLPNNQARWVLLLVGASVVAWGGSIRSQRRLGEDLAVRNTEAAVAAERARLARELHDVAAHHLTALVLQARVAARLTSTDPDRAAAVADAVAEEGSTTLAALRRTVAVLGSAPLPADPASTPGPRTSANVPRNVDSTGETSTRAGTDAAPDVPRNVDSGVQAAMQRNARVANGLALAPLPTLAHIGGLADRCRAAGLDVSLTVAGAIGALPPDIDLAAYRMAQEALTNVLRHAGAQLAAVSVDRDPDWLHVSVSDDGAEAPDPATVTRGGGLTGLNERVRACGGDWWIDRAGERGGWRVVASFPLARCSCGPSGPCRCSSPAEPTERASAVRADRGERPPWALRARRMTWARRARSGHRAPAEPAEPAQQPTGAPGPVDRT